VVDLPHVLRFYEGLDLLECDLHPCPLCGVEELVCGWVPKFLGEGGQLIHLQ